MRNTNDILQFCLFYLNKTQQQQNTFYCLNDFAHHHLPSLIEMYHFTKWQKPSSVGIMPPVSLLYRANGFKQVFKQLLFFLHSQV